MSKITDNYANLSANIGFTYDAPTNTMYGTKNGYEILIYASDPIYPYCFTITTAAGSAGAVIGKEENALFKKMASFVSLSQENNLIIVTTKNSTKNQEKIRQNTLNILDALTAFLRKGNFTPCCQGCGASAQTGGFMLNGSRLHLCAECMEKVKRENEAAAQAQDSRDVSMIGGITGAIAGSLIGVLCIVIFGQLGYVAAGSGAIMAFCTLRGFNKLGRKLTVSGIVLSCIIMMGMTYLGNRLNWAIDIFKTMKEYYDINIFESFQMVPELIASADAMGDYIASFFQQLLFIVIGAVPTIISIMRKQKMIHCVSPIGYIHSADAFANSSGYDNVNRFQ